MNTELTRIIHNVILESSIPAKTLARELGKPYSTLLREVNPYDAGAKLGVETFMALIKLTGDITPMEYIADELGMELVPKNLRRTG